VSETKDILIESLELRVSDLEDDAERLDKNFELMSKALERVMSAYLLSAEGWEKTLKILLNEKPTVQ